MPEYFTTHSSSYLKALEVEDIHEEFIGYDSQEDLNTPSPICSDIEEVGHDTFVLEGGDAQSKGFIANVCCYR